MTEENRHRGRRWLAMAVKLLIVVLVVWFIRRTLVEAWEELGKRHWQFDFWWLVASGGFYLLGSLLCGIFWHRTLLALGQNVSLLNAIRAFYIGHLGKYVPGKAMVVVLRAGLIRGPGVDTALAATSVFFETLTMMSVGSLMAAAIVVIWFHEHALLFWAALAMMLVAGLPTLPPVFRRLVRWVGVGRSNPEIVGKLDRLGYRVVALGWVLNALGWVILGLSFWAVLRALGVGEVNPFERLYLHTAAVSLATVAGFVSLVPGGAVVREAVLTELTGPYLGGSVALVSAILLRLVWLLAELAASGVLYAVAFTRGDRVTKNRLP